MKLMVSFFVLSFIMASCHHGTIETANTIPVIGKNSQGEVTVDHVPQSLIAKKFSGLSNQIQTETIGVLEQHISQTPWELSRITVGLKLESEVEVFEVFEVEGEAHIEFRFQKRS